MCLAVPALIQTIDDQQMAQVDMGGITLNVSLALTPDAQVGDYVIVHAGFAISVLNQQEAEETLQLFADIEAAYQSEQNQGESAS